jgi:hypothetical protein
VQYIDAPLRYLGRSDADNTDESHYRNWEESGCTHHSVPKSH